jgi:uracil-DNA glycosylase
LYELGIEQRTLPWNALQLHPHKPAKVWSNRPPLLDELRQGAPALAVLMQAIPKAQWVAVGKKAERALLDLGEIV